MVTFSTKQSGAYSSLPWGLIDMKPHLTPLSGSPKAMPLWMLKPTRSELGFGRKGVGDWATSSTSLNSEQLNAQLAQTGAERRCRC